MSNSTSMSAAQQQAMAYQQNMNARASLLSTGVAMIKQLPLVTMGLGQQVQIPGQRVGVTTGFLLQCTANITIANAAATLSGLGPWNIFNRVLYTDFAGTNRVNTNGISLYSMQSIKHNDLAGNAIPGVLPNIGNIDTDILAAPTGVGTWNVTFDLWVPLAYDPKSDLRGAILTQTTVGDHYITLQTANALSGDPFLSPFTSTPGNLTLNSLNIQAFQFYIQPQNLNPASPLTGLPTIDLSTVYYVEGNYTQNQNITTGGSTFINYPNNRSVLSGLFIFENGGTFTPNGTDITKLVLIANSNTNLRELNPRLLRAAMRSQLGGDLPTGMYYVGSRQQPILTNLYGNVQLRFDIANAAAGTTQIISQYESFAAAGAPLPGVVTG
jgi:hypothetical protein